MKTYFPRVIHRLPSFQVTLMLPYLAAILLAMIGQLMLARAEDAPALGASFISLFTAIQGKSAAAVVIMHVFQILRTHEVFGILGKIGLSGTGLKVAIAIITSAGFVAEAYGRGAPLAQALIEGLFTAGGAMMIFDAFKKSTADVVVAAPALIASAKLAKKGLA